MILILPCYPLITMLISVYFTICTVLTPLWAYNSAIRYPCWSLCILQPAWVYYVPSPENLCDMIPEQWDFGNEISVPWCQNLGSIIHSFILWMVMTVTYSAYKPFCIIVSSMAHWAASSVLAFHAYLLNYEQFSAFFPTFFELDGTVPGITAPYCPEERSFNDN